MDEFLRAAGIALIIVSAGVAYWFVGGGPESVVDALKHKK